MRPYPGRVTADPPRRRHLLGAPAVLAGEAAAAAAEVEAALTVSDPRVAAFFDIDNTVVRGASIFYLARGLARRGFFTTRDVVRFLEQQVRFRIGGTEVGHIDQFAAIGGVQHVKTGLLGSPFGSARYPQAVNQGIGLEQAGVFEQSEGGSLHVHGGLLGCLVI